MAQFDLKNATIYIKDGYTAAGAVNNVAGYTTGASTMTVDGFTGALHNFDIFKITGQTTEYQITAHSETLSNTTSITFTPSLTAGAADNAVITVQPRRLEVEVGEGNITWTEKKTREYKLDRGILDEVRDGDQSPVEVKFDVKWEFLRASTGLTPTIEDALKKRGEASHWVSSDSDTCRPYCVDIEIVNVPVCGSAEKETITLPDFRYEEIPHDAKAGTFSCTGKCNVTEPTVVRSAA